MSQIRLTDNGGLPLLDRLESNTEDRVDGPKVSIIMPTFSPGPGIKTAVRSLLQQTWQNIEIIIVDDASPDEFQNVFSELEDLDPRIRVVRQAENAGAYVARNTGLGIATGEFVITHDDDDWSHPDKLAVQAAVLVADVNVIATTSAHIRTTQDMVFQRVNMHARYMQMNYSSLMFRRAITDEIGPWDTVNRGGDSEFLTRVIENFGSERVVELMDMPLSFSRVWSGSLTSGEMSRGYFAYSRLLYRWAFRQWQWDVAKIGKKAIRNTDEPRPYAVPTSFEPNKQDKDHGLFDVIYVTDFFRQAKFVNFVMDDIRVLEHQGLRIGFMHLNSPQTNKPAGFPKELFDLQRAGRITQISYNDIAETKLLIVYDASIGMFLDELKSSLVSRRSLLIDHELPTLVGSEERTPTLMNQALRHLDQAFGTTFEVVGATVEDQDRVQSQVPGHRVLPEEMTWHTHLSQKPGTVRAPGSIPIVGFHSYGNVYRWPSNKNEFSKLYVSPAYNTRFFCHVEAAREKFGEQLFGQTELFDFEQYAESEFLDGIDFWVYYPHYRLQDQIWRPVLSAMRAGKVVILPPRLEPIYGVTAIYADSGEVGEVVLQLSSNSTSYIIQSERGQDFVASAYSEGHLRGRIRALTGTVISTGS